MGISSSPLHHASLVDPALHSPALLQLIDIKITRPIIDYVVECVVETVDYAMGRPSSSSRTRSAARQAELAKFTTFVDNVVSRAEVATPTLLAGLVYIDRAKPHLHIALEEWALERVFLGALIVASKYLNDSTLKNVHWALCTGVFGKRDIGRIEREFLDVLDFELGITEDELLSHHAGLWALASPSPSPRTFIQPRAPQAKPATSHIKQASSSSSSSSTSSSSLSLSSSSSSSSSPHRHRIPDLEPSSPQTSSMESVSPRTPASPTYSPQRKAPLPPARPAPAPTIPVAAAAPTAAAAAPVAPVPTIKKPSLHTATMDLLRSFPVIPLPIAAHKAKHHFHLPHPHVHVPGRHHQRSHSRPAGVVMMDGGAGDAMVSA